jgi:2-polyprenyl-3-methyl-5-hydroxy-6-metoxy-1,4-benzoquinol methylase
MSKPKCSICSSLTFFLLEKNRFKLYRCANCGLVFVSPLPTKSALDKLYSTKTGYQANKVLDLNQLPERQNDLKIINYLVKKKPKGKILDVGCSNGLFLFAAKKRGFKTFGIEVNEGTAKSAIKNGLKVQVGIINNAKYPKKFFDVIFLGDVIEHVTDPKKFLKKSLSFLKDDGIIVISTPNLDCFWAKTTFRLFKLLKIPWSSVTPPYHLFQFSLNNLILLTQNYNLKTIKNWYNGPPPLSYELWYTNFAKDFSERKNLINFIKYYLTYIVYGFFYMLNKIISKIQNKDNGMVVCFEKLN